MERAAPNSSKRLRGGMRTRNAPHILFADVLDKPTTTQQQREGVFWRMSCTQHQRPCNICRTPTGLFDRIVIVWTSLRGSACSGHRTWRHSLEPFSFIRHIQLNVTQQTRNRAGGDHLLVEAVEDFLCPLRPIGRIMRHERMVKSTPYIDFTGRNDPGQELGKYTCRVPQQSI